MISKQNSESLKGSSFTHPDYDEVTFVYLGESPEGKGSVKKLYAKTHDYHTCFAKWTAGQVVAPLLETRFREKYEEPFEVDWKFLEKARLN